MNSKFRSFSKRLTHRIVLALILTLAVMFAIIYYVAVGITKILYEDGIYSIMDVQSEIVEKMLYGVELSVCSSVSGIEKTLARPETMYATLEEELNNHPHIAGFFTAFEAEYYPGQGRWFEPYAVRMGDSIVQKQVGSQVHDYLKSEWYQKALQNDNGYWSEPYMDDTGTGLPLCTYAIPLRDAKGRKVGVFGADVSLDWLHQELQKIDEKANTKRMGLDKNARSKAYTFIVGPDGTYIVHPDKSRILKDKFSAIDFTKEKEGKQEVELDGKQVYVFYEDLHNTGWTMGFVVNKRLIWVPVIFFGIIMVLAMALALLAVYIISRLTIRRSTKPLQALAFSAEEVAKGNFTTPLPVLRHHDEIYQLRDSFANMQLSLASYIEELKKTTAEKASMESELTIARDIQMSMIPKRYPAFPEREDIDIYGSMTPAKEVGGDLYDFLIRDNRLYFCIGDVSGKGIPAALLMTVTRNLFRTLANEEQCPERMMSRINTSLCDGNDAGWFVTMIIGVLNLQTGHLTYCNAGHIPPLLMGNEVSRLPLKPILAAGSLEFTSYTAMETTLLPQTTLFLFTDGLTEAKNTDKQMFGDDRTLQVATRLQQEQLLEPKQVVTSMNDAVKAFVGEAEQSDDLTMLAIQYKGSEEIVDTMKLDVSIDEMPRVSNFVISQAKRSGMDEERTSDLRMAVEEAVANIVNYSGASDIILGATEQDGKLCMVLSDDGSSFDPTAMPPPDLTLPGEKRKIGGLGIHYMRQMSDSLAYRREADRNILTIIKNIL